MVQFIFIQTGLLLCLFFSGLNCQKSSDQGKKTAAVNLTPQINQLKSAAKLLNGPQHAQGISHLQAALAELLKLAETTPGNADIQFQIGRAYFLLSKDAEAMKHYNSAIALDGKKAQFHFMKGILQRFMRDDPGAQQSLTQATQLDPQKAKYWHELGEIYYGRKEDAKALPLFKKALEQDPKYAKSLFKVGVILASQKNRPEAKKYWEKAISSDPKYLNAHYNLGQMMQDEKKLKEALASFQTVLSLDPTDWKARSKLIQLYEALGDATSRDQAYQALYALRKGGKIETLNKANSFCREQYEVEGKKVLAYEFFELQGKFGRLYLFSVLAPDGTIAYEISLGSYEATTAMAREKGSIKANERLYHLDGYFPKQVHKTYLFLKEKPSYAELKKQVSEVISGKVKPVSGYQPKQ